MRELVVRAHGYRSRLGDPSGLATARLLAAGIDNPTLTPLLDGHHRQGVTMTGQAPRLRSSS
jgi:hypothetical protein